MPKKNGAPHQPDGEKSPEADDSKVSPFLVATGVALIVLAALLHLHAARYTPRRLTLEDYIERTARAARRDAADAVFINASYDATDAPPAEPASTGQDLPDAPWPTPKPKTAPRQLPGQQSKGDGQTPLEKPTALKIWLTADKRIVNPYSDAPSETQVRLSADGFDGYGVQPIYHWKADAGRIIGEGRSVVWDLSDAKPGAHQVNVVAEISNRYAPNCSRCWAVGQTSVLVRGEPSCPKVTRSCPAAVTPGYSLTLTADASGGTRGVNPTYRWETTGGKILSGQGTRSVEIYTAGLEGRPIDVTVELLGYGRKCEFFCTVTPPVVTPTSPPTPEPTSTPTSAPTDTQTPAPTSTAEPAVTPTAAVTPNATVTPDPTATPTGPADAPSGDYKVTMDYPDRVLGLGEETVTLKLAGVTARGGQTRTGEDQSAAAASIVPVTDDFTVASDSRAEVMLGEQDANWSWQLKPAPGAQEMAFYVEVRIADTGRTHTGRQTNPTPRVWRRKFSIPVGLPPGVKAAKYFAPTSFVCGVVALVFGVAPKSRRRQRKRRGIPPGAELCVEPRPDTGTARLDSAGPLTPRWELRLRHVTDQGRHSTDSDGELISRERKSHA